MAHNPPPQQQWENHMRVWETRIVLFGAHLNAIASFASLTINSIILANSASAGAVLAFLATMWGKPEAENVAGPALESVQIFAAGVLAAMLSAGFSYFAQFCYSRGDMSENEHHKSVWEKCGIALHVVAIFMAIGGVLSFGFGAASGIDALAAANGGYSKP